MRIPVHGFVEVEGSLLDLMDSPQLQRLRRIRQLGLADLVYPGAVHTRFEHSLGVKHLCDRLLEVQWDAMSEREDLGRFQRRYVAEVLGAAGMVHDVGHPPFSHVLEPLIETVVGMDHEDVGRRVARVALETAGVTDPESVLEVAFGGGSGWTAVLHELIAGELGVDRLDYLERDSLHTGVAYGVIEVDRLLHTVEIPSGDGSGAVVVSPKGLEAAESVLVARYHMYRAVYFHRTCRSADTMLLKAASVAVEDGAMDLGFLRKVDSDEGAMEDFLAWDDVGLLVSLSEAGDVASELVSMLRERRLYKCVGTVVLEEEPSVEDLFLVAEEVSETVAEDDHSVLLDCSRIIPYEPGSEGILIRTSAGLKPLSEVSEVVSALKEKARWGEVRVRIYSRPDVAENLDGEEVERLVKEALTDRLDRRARP